MAMQRHTFTVWKDLNPVYKDRDIDLCNYMLADAKRQGYIYIGTQEVDIEVPDNFDPRPHQIAELEERRRELRAKFEAALTEIAARISKLQAIEAPEAA